MLTTAMAHAAETGALSWRLRAAIDLARLWRAGTKADAARSLLSSVVDTFTEGFATRDLAIAAELAAEFAAQRAPGLIAGQVPPRSMAHIVRRCG
jgi:hypothetical protein